jgi:hypothetical protein
MRRQGREVAKIRGEIVLAGKVMVRGASPDINTLLALPTLD